MEMGFTNIAMLGFGTVVSVCLSVYVTEAL
jgi:hypothetical protein